MLMSKTVISQTLEPNRSKVRIDFAELGNNAGLIGAAQLVSAKTEQHKEPF
jgi:hypothetical protein